jgi:DHA2 family multidrug resistance protein-like MFS transporter
LLLFSKKKISFPSMIHPDGLPTPQRYWSMLAIALGITVAVLDSSVANIALPAITRQLHAAPAAAVWVVNAYQLVIVVSLLPLASLGERVGYRRVYMAGLVVFTAGSLACALSHSLPVLIAARAAQGLGGAGIMSVNGALVRFTYPTALLGRGLGLNALVVSGAAVMGPTIAAAVLSVASWEWLFAINVPIGMLNLGLAARALPYSERAAYRFDWTSAALNAVMFGLFFLGVDALTQGHGNRLAAWCEVVVVVGAGLVLFRRGARTAAPLIPVDLLKIPVFGLSVVASVCAFTAQMLSFVALPFYFEYSLHFGQAQTGLLMTPWPVGLGIMAPVAGRLSDRMPAAVLGGIGMAVLALGLALLAMLPAHADAAAIVWRMAVCGVGFGFFQSPNNRTMLTSAPRLRAGAAGGMLATARLTGMTIGATLAALVFHLAPGGAEPVELFVATGCAVAAGGASLLRLGGAGGAKLGG